MSRPYVICHMLTSVDGKIDGEFFSAPETVPALREYASLREAFGCSAALYGATTMRGGFSDGAAENIPRCDKKIPREDYKAPNDAEHYIVSVDPSVTLGFNSGYIKKKNRPRAHVIEVLLETVSDGYLAYLRNAGVSYIFAGKDKLNCSLMLEKLGDLFGIERLLAAGGGITNQSLASEDLIDELSVVIAPAADGDSNAASIFERGGLLPAAPPKAFKLKDISQTGDVVHLLYIPKR